MVMAVSYKKLWIMLIEKNITKKELRQKTGFSQSTQTKLSKGEFVALSVLVDICNVLDCNIGDIMDVVKGTEI